MPVTTINDRQRMSPFGVKFRAPQGSAISLSVHPASWVEGVPGGVMWFARKVHGDTLDDNQISWRSLVSAGVLEPRAVDLSRRTMSYAPRKIQVRAAIQCQDTKRQVVDPGTCAPRTSPEPDSRCIFSRLDSPARERTLNGDHGNWQYLIAFRSFPSPGVRAGVGEET